jgi:hypothetical protein
MNKSTTAQCAKAVTLFRGLYARVAHKLGVDASYVSRIARGKRKSKLAETTLIREFDKATAIMRSGSGEPRKNYVVLTQQCPRCKTQQKVHIISGPGFQQASGERLACLNCNHRFKVNVPNKIIRGPFPA